MVPFESLGVVSYLPLIATMAISLAVCEIFSIKKWRDLENWVRGCSRSLETVLFNRPYTTLYWSALVSNLYLVPFVSYLMLNNITTLKSMSGFTQGHWKRHHSKA